MKSDRLSRDHTDDGSTNHGLEPIAIVGMGCRFPGAANVSEYWDLLREGRETITEIPSDRWDVDRYYDPHPATPGKMCTRRGGFLENLNHFDPYFFGISPREVIYQDPQQRLLLEVAWEAVEDAGILRDELRQSHAGMFLSASRHSGRGGRAGNRYGLNVYMATGGADGTAGRLCSVLGLDGPAAMIEAACSSSLVAVHLACAALRNRECELAFAGGANVIPRPDTHIMLSQAGMLSPDGRCKSFAADANGYVRSEGAGIVVLKRLSTAIADGDRIHAVIRASAMTNDGAHSPLMAPSQLGQEAALRQAYDRAGITAADVQYIEAHGTGTPVGDPIEVKALGAVMAESRTNGDPCLIASCKTNIGHTEAAAGVAGLIKTALCLEHRMIPPSLHSENLNPDISWDDIPLVVQQQLMPWPKNGTVARAGVNSFGVTGTNVHAVLEEAPPPPEVRSQDNAGVPQLLTLSARMQKTLNVVAGQHRTLFDQDVDAAARLRDICYTASARRTHYDHRLAVVARSPEEFSERLEAYIEGEERQGLWHGQRPSEFPGKPVFLFSGAGSQWIGMGRRLREEEPCFRNVFEQCDEAVRRHLGWSVFEEIDAPEERSRLNRLDVTQAVVFSMQVALAELWKSWGIEPAAVVGHSLGEYAAAHVAGALTLDDALRAMCARSRLIESLADCGRMLAVGVGGKDAHAAIAGYEESVSVAVLNSPTSTVLSGDPDALEAIKTRFDEQDVFARWVATNIASHSPQVDAIAPRLEQALQDLETRSERVPIYSTVTGGPLPGTEFGGSYWARNLRECVRFGPVIEDLLAAGHHMFIEVSPHPVLQVPVQQTAEHVGRKATALPSMRRDEGDRAVPLESLGALYTMGHSVDWTKLYPDGGRVTSLPSYPWPRERFSVADESVGPDLLVNSDHPFLRYRWESAQHPGTFHWEVELDSKSFPYITEHQIQGVPLYPGAGFLELVLAAVREVYGEGPCVFHDVEFNKVLSFREDEVKRLQLVVAPARPGQVSFKLYNRSHLSESATASWTLLANGFIETDPKLPDTVPSVQFSAESLDVDFLEKLDSTEFYERVADINAQLGPTFQGVRQVWYYGSTEKAICRLQVPDAALRQAAGHPIHPGFFDTILHTYWIFHIMSSGSGQQELPVGIRRLEIHQLPDPESELWSQSWLADSATANGTRDGHTEVFDRRGKLLIRESGHVSKKIEKAAENNGDRDVNEWLYAIDWENQSLPEGSIAGQIGAFLILADRRGLGDRIRAVLESRGVPCRFVEFEGDEPWSVADFEQVVGDLRTASGGPYHVVYLAALDAPPNSDISLEYLASEPKRICGGALHLLQALGKQAWESPCRLWCVTRGAQSLRDGHEASSVAQAPLLGLGRVMAAEYPNFQVSRVDLDPAEPTGEVEALLQEFSAQSEHQVVAWRQGQRNVASMSRLLERNEGLVTRKSITISDQSEDSYRLETSGVGILDNLSLRPCPRRQPEPGEVEVRIVTAGLNFIDVLRGLAMFPGPKPKSQGFGMECSGRIVACGEGVTQLNVDDEVIVMGAGFTGLFRAFVTTSATHVFRKPEHLTFEEAATIPVAYQTAYYSFVHLARLQKGESVLIHSAAGGVGLAAVELAKQIGAVVFATAGSEEKREYLKSLGVEHVMNSRTLDFAEEILTYTQGRGVDVVLNSLAGEAIAKSLSVLATGGRFVEIGKRDIYDNTQLGLLPFQKNLSFFAVDLMRLSQERPEVVSSLTREVIERIHDGTFKALPYRTFRADEAADAFHFMAQGKHTGKVILNLDLPEVEVEMAAEQPIQVRSDATYLITGGLGGLGLVFARSLVDKGARHLALIGRRGATPDSQPEIAAMEEMGAEVWTAAADVSSPADMDRVLAEIRKSMPPIKGVIHGAGILNDRLLESLDWPNFEKVLPSKIAGGWILHTRLRDDDLDFFAIFSSAASLIGGSGQGNYAAANAFLDGLVGYRRAQGLPAVSFNWGPWAEVGLAARLAEQGKLTASQGFDSIRPKEGVKIFDYGLARNDAQLIVMPTNWKRRTENGASGAEDAIVIPFGRESIKHAHRETEATVLAAVRAATDRQEAQQVIEEFLKDQISSVLKIPKDRIDRQIGIDRLGLDSLMAMELKVRVESTLPVTLAVVRLLQGPSLIELSESLSADLVANDLGAKAPEPIVSLSDRAPRDVDQMSDDEVDASLAQLSAEPSAIDG